MRRSGVRISLGPPEVLLSTPDHRMPWSGFCYSTGDLVSLALSCRFGRYRQQFRIKQSSEWFSQVAVDLDVSVDIDQLEHALVDLTPLLMAGQIPIDQESPKPLAVPLSVSGGHGKFTRYGGSQGRAQALCLRCSLRLSADLIADREFKDGQTEERGERSWGI